MPRILDTLLETPPRVFTIQTRGALILHDLERLRALSRRTTLRVSFPSRQTGRTFAVFTSLTARVSKNGLMLSKCCGTRALKPTQPWPPLLACDPEVMARAALEASNRDLIGDPLHIRATKRHGATTRAGCVQDQCNPSP